MRAIGKGYEGYFVNEHGFVYSMKRDGLLRPMQTFDKLGYRSVQLSGARTRMVHRLVALAFIGQPMRGSEVNHKNGIKFDNRPENLEWVSHKENMAHASMSGLYASAKGSLNPNVTISEHDVADIRKMLRDGVRQVDIARRYGIQQAAVSKIKLRHTWRHVK